MFGDNFTANDVFIRGTSSIRMWRDLLMQLEMLDERFQALAWMTRVPSSSNVADPPSRGSLEELKVYKPCVVKQVTCPIKGQTLQSFLNG